MKTPIAVLISGRGTNLQSLIDASSADDYPAQIVCVLSDKADAGGLKRAAAADIEHATIPREHFPSRSAFEDAIQGALEQSGAQVVCLAGFMRILSAAFVARWPDKILNIHPSLLPAFRGLNTHARALDAGVKWHGATVHIVTETLDDGPILAQAAVPVEPPDDPETLAARVLRAEHRLYPATLDRFLQPQAHPAHNPTMGEGAYYNPPL